MWTAIALWSINGALLAGYVFVAARQVAAGGAAWPWIVAVPVIYFAIVFVMTAVYFAIAWVRRSPRPGDRRVGMRASLRLFAREFWALAGATPRLMAYRRIGRDPPRAPARDPVLLLHGVLCNAGVWRSMKRRLSAQGIGPLYALSYGPPLASIDLFAEQVASKIDAILAATGAAQVSVVAHSMGGLVARAYLRRYGGAKLRKVITIGTPHAGSAHAWMFPGVSLAQLRPGNAWLAALPIPSRDSTPPFVSLWSWHDSMVAPQTSARLEYGRNIELTGVGHNALLTDPEVARRVAEELRASGPDTAVSQAVGQTSV
ncbi:MAG: alpha/beta fold hydrolase [Burkholderiales bacterium]|nr:alpha/beta fold hydrolase [Burkholderiales bacterium]MCE7877325.1 alpha/beta fold hydrolase [Betaproteobacteria bacterium PRO3]